MIFCLDASEAIVLNSLSRKDACEAIVLNSLSRKMSGLTVLNSLAPIA